MSSILSSIPPPLVLKFPLTRSVRWLIHTVHHHFFLSTSFHPRFVSSPQTSFLLTPCCFCCTLHTPRNQSCAITRLFLDNSFTKPVPSGPWSPPCVYLFSLLAFGHGLALTNYFYIAKYLTSVGQIQTNSKSLNTHITYCLFPDSYPSSGSSIDINTMSTQSLV